MTQNRLTLSTSGPVLLISEKILHYRPPRISMLLLVLATTVQWVVPPVRVELFNSPLLAVCAATTGFTIMMWAWWQFKSSQVAICPTEYTSRLITHGAYQLSRNPMYLGMLLMLIGVALWIGTLPFYLAATGFFLVIQQAFCPYEEAKLMAEFGQKYQHYKSAVRRWL